MQPNPECRLRDVDLLCELAAGEAVTPALRVDEFLEGRMWLFVFDQAAAGRNFAASTPLNNETKPLTVKHWVGGSIPRFLHGAWLRINDLRDISRVLCDAAGD